MEYLFTYVYKFIYYADIGNGTGWERDVTKFAYIRSIGRKIVVVCNIDLNSHCMMVTLYLIYGGSQF